MEIRTHLDAVKAWLAPEKYDYPDCAFCTRRRVSGSGADCNPSNCVAYGKGKDMWGDPNSCCFWRDIAESTKLRVARYVVKNYKGGGAYAIRRLIAEALPKKYRAGYTGE